MKIHPSLSAPLLAAVVFNCLITHSPAAEEPSPQDPDATIERGRYLVTQVGMCQDCHTPRDENGMLLEDKWLQGSLIKFSPLMEMPWADAAPGIAGLPGYTDDDAKRLLTSAVSRTGEPLRPPMPPYKFSNEDADAVISYLRSLAPGTSPAVSP